MHHIWLEGVACVPRALGVAMTGLLSLYKMSSWLVHNFQENGAPHVVLYGAWGAICCGFFESVKCVVLAAGAQQWHVLQQQYAQGPSLRKCYTCAMPCCMQNSASTQTPPTNHRKHADASHKSPQARRRLPQITASTQTPPTNHSKHPETSWKEQHAPEA